MEKAAQGDSGDQGVNNVPGVADLYPHLAELEAIARVSPAQSLSPIPANVMPETREFAETMRVLFGALGISLNRLAALMHSDPGTVSRYLSGNRIPPPGFIDDLLKAIYDVKGSLVTPQVQELVHEQFLAALRERNPERYEIQRLTDLLRVAAREKRQYQITMSALEEAIASRNDKIYALELESRQLRSAWTQDEELLDEERRRHVQLQETLEGLYTQVSHLKEQLRSAQRRAVKAEQRCRELENRLDAAGAILHDEAQPTPAHEALAATLEQGPFSASVRQAASPGWWDRYSDIIPGWFRAFISMEQAAKSVWLYETQFVPGLLQTGEYAAAVVSLGEFTSEQAERRVELRKERQRRFRDGMREFRVILDEAALHESITDSSAHLDQLRHLRAACTEPALTLQILPPHAGRRVAPNGFSILRFDEPHLPDVVCVESLTRALYLDQQEDVNRYLSAMERLSALSYEPQMTSGIIDRVIAELEGESGR